MPFHIARSIFNACLAGVTFHSKATEAADIVRELNRYGAHVVAWRNR